MSFGEALAYREVFAGVHGDARQGRRRDESEPARQDPDGDGRRDQNGSVGQRLTIGGGRSARAVRLLIVFASIMGELFAVGQGFPTRAG